jgi:hypothetical protein
VHADTALPVLVEMVVRYLLIMFDRLVRVRLVSIQLTASPSLGDTQVHVNSADDQSPARNRDEDEDKVIERSNTYHCD